MSGQLDWERPKGEPTPLTKLMFRLAPIVDDIVAGRTAVAVCKDYGIRCSDHCFIRKEAGIKHRNSGRKVPESRIAAVMEYSLTHTIKETAEKFSISVTTVCRDIRRACGRQA